MKRARNRGFGRNWLFLLVLRGFMTNYTLKRLFEGSLRGFEVDPRVITHELSQEVAKGSFVRGNYAILD